MRLLESQDQTIADLQLVALVCILISNIHVQSYHNARHSAVVLAYETMCYEIMSVVRFA